MTKQIQHGILRREKTFSSGVPVSPNKSDRKLEFEEEASLREDLQPKFDATQFTILVVGSNCNVEKDILKKHNFKGNQPSVQSTLQYLVSMKEDQRSCY